MTEQELFREKAENGYIICTVEHCPMKEQCLRWKVGQQLPATVRYYQGINPRYQDVATEHCPHYRPAGKVLMAKGMVHIFNGDMPKRVEPFVRQHLLSRHCHTYYYEYRNGSRLIPPSMQEEVRHLFRQAGWNEAVEFDDYVEDYEW